jgi:FMN phosphatase YigB (HAD superfamily)
MKTLKLIAVDIDGPLLTDSFAPLLKLSCEFYGLAYTREMEDNMFSRNRAEATAYFKSQFKEVPEDLKGKSSQDMEQSYFEFRQAYLAENPITLSEGAADLMALLPSMGVRLVCYGGLDEKYMRSELGAAADIFESYICTNDFRPGVREIVEDHYRLAPHQVLFIDDVNFVANHARQLGTCFIGVPARTDWGFQRQGMEDAGLPFICKHSGEIDRALLERVDVLATENSFWKAPAA